MIKRSTKFGLLLPSLTLAAASILGFAAPQGASAASAQYKWTGASSSTAGQNSCTSNCWSVAGNWSYSSDGGSTWATATNAPASADNSGAGADIIFNNTGLSSNTTTTNDIDNLVVNQLVTAGSSSNYNYYTIAGSDFTLTSASPVTTTATPSLYVNPTVTVANDMTWGTSESGKYMRVSVNKFNVPSGKTLTTYGSLSSVKGAGTLILGGIADGDQYPNNYSIYGSQTFSGVMRIQKGAVLLVDGPAALGTSKVYIEDGGSLSFGISPTPAAHEASLTVANELHIAGSGAGAPNQTVGAIIASMYDGIDSNNKGKLTLKFTGDVSLDSDITLASAYDSTVTYNFDGTLNRNNHATKVASRVQPTYGNTIVQVKGATIVDGTAGQTSTPDPGKAPKTPDTGFALSSSKPMETLIFTVLGAATIAGVAFKLRQAPARR